MRQVRQDAKIAKEKREELLATDRAQIFTDKNEPDLSSVFICAPSVAKQFFSSWRPWRLGVLGAILFLTTLARAGDPATQNYLNLLIDYSIYAKSIWHDTKSPDVGGYWGPVGIGEHDQNGAIRGMADTMTDYAYLIHLMDTHGLTDAQQQRLQSAGLDRATLLKYICANLTHITAHHASNLHPLTPIWGFSWQSTMWTGFAGPTLLPSRQRHSRRSERRLQTRRVRRGRARRRQTAEDLSPRRHRR